MLTLRSLSIDQLSNMSPGQFNLLDDEPTPVPGDYYVPPGAEVNWREAEDTVSRLMQRVSGLPYAEAPTGKTPTPLAYMAELDGGFPAEEPCCCIR